MLISNQLFIIILQKNMKKICRCHTSGAALLPMSHQRYLGCEIVRELEAGKTLLSQKHYAEDVLRTYDYWDCIPALNL